jgi:ubiquinone biosynthesis protein
VIDDKPVSGQDAAPNGEFELLEERPPDSLLLRLYVTIRNVAGLVFGGGYAYVRERKAQGTAGNLSILILRFLLAFTWPFLNKEIISYPFPVQFRRRLEMMGPTYIKLGQILSLREDLLPRSITDELQNLLDRLPVVTFERYQELIEADLGVSPSVFCSWIDERPLGSASLAQTHRARLNTGQEVVMKVIKPNVRETIHNDTILLRILGVILQVFLARYQPKRTINEFCTYTLREVDLRFEADNAETFAVNFRDQPNVRFPRIYRPYSGQSVLCMEYFKGRKPDLTTAATLSESEKHRIIDLGVSSIVQMIFKDGFFHADLHPGNLMLLDNMDIGFLDLGMVGRLDDSTRKTLLYYFYSVVMTDAENAARILSNMAIRGPRSDPEGLRRELTDLNRRWVSATQHHRMSIAQLILQSIGLAGRYHVYYPEEIILMVKALVTVEGVAKILDPSIEVIAIARNHIRRIILYELSPSTIYNRAVISAPEFMDVMMRSPMIIARELQHIDQRNQSGSHSSLIGIKETIIAGFMLLTAAVMASGGMFWPFWTILLIIALVVGIRGLSR